MDQDLPDILYKYRRWSDDFSHDKASLLKNEIYFASAEQFNDPFDCSIPVRYENATDEQVIGSIKKHVAENYSHYNREKRRKIEALMIKEKKWKDPSRLESEKSEYLSNLFKRGIFSLCMDARNVLMWSHYSNSHCGYCIGYDRKKMEHFFKSDVFNQSKLIIDPYKVIYSKDYPVFELYDNSTDEEFFVRSLITKSKSWEYEKEVRYICIERTKFSLTLPDEIIVKVILGLKFAKDHISTVISRIKESSDKVSLFQAKMAKYEFALDFEEIDY